MTGNEIYKKALKMLNYTDAASEKRFLSAAIDIINRVYADLFYIDKSDGFKPIKALSDKIDLNERVLYDVMPYGVAAFLAQSENDGDNQLLYIGIYNEKRTSLSRNDRIKDTFPGVW